MICSVDLNRWQPIRSPLKIIIPLINKVWETFNFENTLALAVVRTHTHTHTHTHTPVQTKDKKEWNSWHKILTKGVQNYCISYLLKAMKSYSCKIWGFHISEDSYCGLLGNSTV
jgi:hypothetical protein